MNTITHDSGNGPERHYCVRDAAKLAGMSRQWLHKMIANGEVRADYVRLGRRWVPESEVQRIKVPEVQYV